MKQKKRISSSYKLITLLHGPYEANGVIRHKIQRLRGIMWGLDEKKISHEAIPINKINRLEVKLADRIIITSCDIRQLKFNMSADSDPVCRKILSDIEDNVKVFMLRRTAANPTPVMDGFRVDFFNDQFNTETTQTSNKMVETRTQTGESFPEDKLQDRSYNCTLDSYMASETSDVFNLHKGDTDTLSPAKESSSETCGHGLSIDHVNYYTICHRGICRCRTTGKKDRRTFVEAETETGTKPQKQESKSSELKDVEDKARPRQSRLTDPSLYYVGRASDSVGDLCALAAADLATTATPGKPLVACKSSMPTVRVIKRRIADADIDDSYDSYPWERQLSSYVESLQIGFTSYTYDDQKFGGKETRNIVQGVFDKNDVVVGGVGDEDSASLAPHTVLNTDLSDKTKSKQAFFDSSQSKYNFGTRQFRKPKSHSNAYLAVLNT